MLTFITSILLFHRHFRSVSLAMLSFSKWTSFIAISSFYCIFAPTYFNRPINLGHFLNSLRKWRRAGQMNK